MYQITNNHESNSFDYQVEDYIKQQLWKALEANAVRLIMSGDITTGQATAAALEGFHQQEAEAITRAMKAYYKSFNFKNVEDLLNFWLPNDHCELNIPGFDRAVRLEHLTFLLYIYVVLIYSFDIIIGIAFFFC